MTPYVLDRIGSSCGSSYLTSVLPCLRAMKSSTMPLRSGMVDDFIARKQGKTEVKYELPQLEPILSSTYGVIAYQEQVMRISNVLAGFSLGEADLLRNAMGKKNATVMATMRRKFIEGA